MVSRRIRVGNGWTRPSSLLKGTEEDPDPFKNAPIGCLDGNPIARKYE